MLDRELVIGLTGDGKLFEVMTHNELEQLAQTLLDELDRELDDYARDWFDFISEDGRAFGWCRSDPTPR